jgi:hypothetical protein
MGQQASQTSGRLTFIMAATALLPTMGHSANDTGWGQDVGCEEWRRTHSHDTPCVNLWVEITLLRVG